MNLSETLKIDKFYNSPVARLVTHGVAELEDAGLMFRCGIPGWDTSAIYINDGDEPVAVLVWHVQEWKQEAYIDFGYVRPEYRGMKLYTSLWQALVEEAKSRKLRSIASGTHINNHVMQAIFTQQGRVANSISYRYELPVESAVAA